MQPIPRILSEKIKIFSQFFAAFLKSTNNFEQCEKKKMMSFKAYVFRKL